MIRELSLFTGYGGFNLGLRLAGIETRCVGYVEIEPYCQELLRARIRDGLLDWAPIISDIRSADFRPMAGVVDAITAGFPCQPHSFAGKREGEFDTKGRNLWPDTARLIRGLGVPIVFLENVPGILRYYYDTIRPELREMGYEVTEGLFSAAETGAPHKRQRIFILAYSGSIRS